MALSPNERDNNLSKLSNARMEPFAKFCHETAYYYLNVFKIFSRLTNIGKLSGHDSGDFPETFSKKIVLL